MPENALAPAESGAVTAVIPVHNRADLLRRMLESAAAQTSPFAEMIVVDNASGDNAISVAREFGCRIIALSENSGFARAVNTGWKAASSPWIAVLNSDVELDPQWLEKLKGRAIERQASFAAGILFDAERRTRVDGTYDLVSRAGCAWRAGHGGPHASSEPVAIDIAPGTACLFRREALEQLGGYDESFESYLEDVDLGLRCIRRGFAGVFEPAAVAWHHGSATLGRWNARVVRLISRNQLLLIARHYDAGLFRRCFRAIVAGQMLWGLVAARHGAFGPWLAGKIDGLRNFRLTAAPSPAIGNFLMRSEREIRRRAYDPYWRWYFRLAGDRSASD